MCRGWWGGEAAASLITLFITVEQALLEAAPVNNNMENQF